MNRRRYINFRFSKISTKSELLAEKARLKRRLEKQERRVARSWGKIEDDWQFVYKLIFMCKNLFSSSFWGNIELGFKSVTSFFSKK